VLYPRGYRLSTFDCILRAGFRPDPPALPNIVRVPVNLTAADDAFYEAGVAAFRKRHTREAPRPR
jgi:hypothetical protein